MRRKHKRQLPDGPFAIEIVDLSREGDGIGRQPDGKAVFVSNALPGERVTFLRTQRARDFDRATLVDVLQAAPERVTAPCPHFGVCGGCSLQHLAAAAQVAFKEQNLFDSLARIGKLQPEQRLAPLEGPSLHYRRRARLSVRHDAGAGRMQLGFRGRDGRSLAPLDACLVLERVFGERFTAIRELLHALSIRAQVPQIELAAGDDVAAMVLRVLRAPDAGDRERLAAFSRETGIWIWLQDNSPDSLQPLRPDTPELSYRLPEAQAEIRFGPLDFVQANAEVNRRMVGQALALLDPGAGDSVLELFAGVGNFTLPLARRSARVVAVEGDPRLVARARRNATLNRLNNIEHQLGDLSAADNAAAWLTQKYDAVLLDPPRSGAIEVLPQLAALRPRKILYVSCHPGTLARDAGVLVRRLGYRLRAAGIMDMFPHTSHVESMALFENVA